jgi:hypothetical protein
LVLLALGALAGCPARDPGAAAFVKAVVERPVLKDGQPVFDEAGLARMERKTVTDRDAVAKLASFFSGVGEGKQSSIAGGWKGGYWVKFERADGKSVNVTVNDRGSTWSEGHGDWQAMPGLKEYLDQLLAD